MFKMKINDSVRNIIIMALVIILVGLVVPHSEEYVGWQNTVIACDEYGGCSCSLIAHIAVQEYKQKHNLTDKQFPTYIIANDESPPLW